MGKHRRFPSKNAMKMYQNLSGNSVVRSYQFYGDGIKIKLHNGTTYLFLEEKTGRDTIDRLKTLAKDGRGLGTFVLDLQHNGAQDA